LVKGEVKPPFVPSVKGEDDTGNFDATFTSEPVSIAEGETKPHNDPFETFTFISDEHLN